jgi:uncharacterized protein (TIGR03086 family)
MEPLALLRRASDFYGRHLVAVTEEQWSMPSICDDWTVKDLADHVLGGNRFALGMLAGLDPAAAFDAALVDGFDGDPVIAYRASVQAQLEAFEAPGALDVVVHHPAGDLGAREFLGFRLGDLLLHGWDLARSTGGDASLDDVLVPFVWEAYEPMLDVANGRGAFGEGPSGLVPSDAALSLRLLDLTGRRPGT